MVNQGPLPQTGDAQDIGADAEACFVARKPKDWRPHNLGGTDDYGLDFQVQTVPGQRATDVFRVQLKGTRSPELNSENEFISIQLKATTVRFYERIVEPILLVVCDLSVNPDPVDCPLYYVWVRDELRRIGIDTLNPEQKYVTFRVPATNRLTRHTDLSAEIDRANELARVGQALDIKIEQAKPGMRVEERLGIVKGVERGLLARSPAFIDALSAPAKQHWVEPERGTLAWHLREAERLLRVGAVEKASTELSTAESMLGTGTDIERADFWHLQGKCNTAAGNDQSASECFRKANEEHPTPRHLAAWAEAELRIRYDDGTLQDCSDLLQLLYGDDPLILYAKSRVLAAENKYDEAIAVAELFSGPQSYAAKAIAHIMFSKPEEALAACEAGIALSEVPEQTKQLFVILRARAKFTIALNDVSYVYGEFLPPSGLVGIDTEKLKSAWEAIQAAAETLQEAGWGPNIENFADIWAATSSMLGKQREVLPAMLTAARAKPYFQNLQAALESLAAQCGEFDIALEANSRLTANETQQLRRTLLLHEAGKHLLCVQQFEQVFDNSDRSHTLFGPAATVAAISAHKLARPELVQAWSSELEATECLREHAAMLHYYLATEINKLGNDEALWQLITRYHELGQPFSMSVALLQELDPAIEAQARTCVEVAKRIYEKVEPSAAMAAHVALALVTLTEWEPLLALCERCRARIDAAPRMLAFEALALDRQGRTDEARKLLEQMLAGGLLDSLALNTYVTIMIRCGYVQEALSAAERILEGASTQRQRRDCVRLLFNLVQTSDPGSPRLLALATQMGLVADSNSEVEEGIYLVMFLTATLSESNVPSKQELAEFRRRADAFFTKYPNSKIIKRAETDPDASPSEFLAQLKQVIGLTEESEAFKRKLENQLQQGIVPVPFSWRPKLVLSSVHDVVHLWEVAKKSSVDDKKYHLEMLHDLEWTPHSAALLRKKTPLLDLTSLLVLLDLGLLDATVQFFSTIAIGQATLEELALLASPISGSLFRGKCIALQEALKPHLASILQPSCQSVGDAPDGEEQDDEFDTTSLLNRSSQEIKKLSQQGRYTLYSDDFLFRIFCADGDKTKGICTLDVIAALEEIGEIPRQVAAEKLAILCGWRVGIVVRFEDQLAVIPSKLEKAADVRAGIEILDGSPAFVSMMSALWDFRADYTKTLDHASAVLRRLVDETQLTPTSIASILGVWFVKTKLKEDTPHPPLRILTHALLFAVGHQSLSVDSARKLWSVYRALVDFEYGDQMDEQKERDAIQLMATECARAQVQMKGYGDAVMDLLRQGLHRDTSDDTVFSEAYSVALVRLQATPRS